MTSKVGVAETESENLCEDMKSEKNQSTPGIEPGTVSISKHAAPTYDTRTVVLSLQVNYHYQCNDELYSFSRPGDEVVFLYPDLKTALVGRFEKNVMQEAKETKVVAERCHKGIKEIK